MDKKLFKNISITMLSVINHRHGQKSRLLLLYIEYRNMLSFMKIQHCPPPSHQPRTCSNKPYSPLPSLNRYPAASCCGSNIALHPLFVSVRKTKSPVQQPRTRDVLINPYAVYHPPAILCEYYRRISTGMHKDRVCRQTDILIGNTLRHPAIRRIRKRSRTEYT